MKLSILNDLRKYDVFFEHCRIYSVYLVNNFAMHPKTLHETKSPCRNICKLNEKGKCIGCFRYIDEIANWTVYTEEQKKIILVQTQLRMQLPEYFD